LCPNHKSDAGVQWSEETPERRGLGTKRSIDLKKKGEDRDKELRGRGRSFSFKDGRSQGGRVFREKAAIWVGPIRGGLTPTSGGGGVWGGRGGIQGEKKGRQKPEEGKKKIWGNGNKRGENPT